MHRSTIRYFSSFDQAGPLLADVGFAADGRPKPLLLVMHGYGGGRDAVSQDVDELAGKGVVAVAPDMRGRGESAGTWDSGGLDVHDAVDAALAAIAQFPGEIDARNINLVGYSGGGGNAISIGCRYPDLLNTSVSFFGIPDYAGWYHDASRVDCNQIMKDVLGTPDDQPARYEVRDMTPAAGNARATRWWFFWDKEETGCLPVRVERWLAAYAAAGGRHAQRSVTGPGDARRWHHNYRTGNPDLSAADQIYFPDILRPPGARELALPPAGELVVPGYLVTRHFTVVIGDAQQGCVRIRYRLDGGIKVDVIDNPRGLPVSIKTQSITGSLPV